MALIPQADGTYLDTNDQSARATLRTQGYYIDPTGVYAPGAGTRSGDTFSGSLAGQNVAPSPTQLPIINGTPVSPSNGSTGPQTGAIMYRSDPLYAQYFGPGTPGYSSTSMQANATPTGAQPGQQSLTDFLHTQGSPNAVTTTYDLSKGEAPGPNADPSLRAAFSLASAQNQPSTPQAAQDANQSSDASWAAGLQSPNPGGGFGPYMTTDAPLLEDQGQYVENGKVIKKSVDQYGNAYFQTVGSAPSTPQTGASAEAPSNVAAGTAGPGPQTPGQAAPPGTTPLTMPDGSVVNVPTQFYADYQKDQAALATANQKAQQFQQGIQQGQLDVQRMVATYDKAYHDALIQGQSAQLAQNMAIEKMRDELQQQTIDLNKVIQQQTAAYQNAQLEQQRQQSAQTLGVEQQRLADARSQAGQTNSLEQDKLSLARQQQRGRRLPQVRYA